MGRSANEGVLLNCPFTFDLVNIKVTPYTSGFPLLKKNVIYGNKCE